MYGKIFSVSDSDVICSPLRNKAPLSKSCTIKAASMLLSCTSIPWLDASMLPETPPASFNPLSNVFLSPSYKFSDPLSLYPSRKGSTEIWFMAYLTSVYIDLGKMDDSLAT